MKTIAENNRKPRELESVDGVVALPKKSFAARVADKVSLNRKDETGKWQPPKWLVTLVWAVGFIAVWEFSAIMVNQVAGNTSNTFPHLYSIIYFAFSPEYCGRHMGEYVWDTLSLSLVGFAIGILLGMVIAILMNLFITCRKIAYPLLLLSQMLPMLALAPIFMSIIPNLATCKIVMAAWMTFFPVAANTFAGMQAVDSEKAELLKITSANVFQKYVKLYIPASLPSFFIGAKIAFPAAICAVIFTEVLKTDGGLGYGIMQSQYSGQWGLCWGYILMAIALAVASYYIAAIAEKLIVRYRVAN